MAPRLAGPGECCGVRRAYVRQPRLMWSAVGWRCCGRSSKTWLCPVVWPDLFLLRFAGRAKHLHLGSLLRRVKEEKEEEERAEEEEDGFQRQLLPSQPERLLSRNSRKSRSSGPLTSPTTSGRTTSPASGTASSLLCISKLFTRCGSRYSRNSGSVVLPTGRMRGVNSVSDLTLWPQIFSPSAAVRMPRM